MNSQLPPIDEDLRAQLARRSAGRLPEDLLAATYARLDVAPPQPRRWTVRRVPRLAVAGGALALIAILAAALVVVPRFQVGPAASGQWSYPADRALTSPELALLMSGPALPTNTALVANVVIGIRADVCPMGRYPTVGIVEGMNSQVCVMASDLSAVPTGHTASGTFAFRYLAPGYLGLLGEITPASSATVAFRVADDWPLQGKTFLVDGWLTQIRFPVTDVAFCTGGTPVPAGDPLDPNGSDPCVGSWLTDSPNSLPTRAPDGLEIPKAARSVEAAGMGDFDAIPSGVAIHGVYVVRSVTEQCSGASPQDNRGCSAWRVLARVAEISVPAPSGTPLEVATAAPTTEPPATPLAPNLTGVIGTGNRPLTADELETLMVEQPDHLAGRIVIVEAPIPTQISCQGDANGGGCAVNTKPLAQAGTSAVSIGAEGALSLVGQIATPIAAGYVFSVEEACLDTNLKAGAVLVVFGVLNKDSIGSWRLTQAGTSAGCGSIDLGAGSYASMGPSLPSNYAGEAPRAYYLVRVGSPWSALARLEPAAGPG
jgi:hypothetical protein